MDFERSFEQAFEVEQWFVTFHRHSSRWWVNWGAAGRFKHVSAFGYVVAAECWAFFDVMAGRTRIRLVRDRHANLLLAREAESGVVVRMPPMSGEARDPDSVRLKPGFWCVPATAHLIGLGGCALRPDRLFAQCLANGGEIVTDDGQ